VRRFLLAAFFLAGLAVAVPVHAGAPDFVKSTEITALGGSLSLADVFDPADEDPVFARYGVPLIKLEGGFLWGFRLGHRFTRPFGAEISLGFCRGEVTGEDTLGTEGKFTDLSTVVYNVDGLLYLPYFGESFEPFLAAGVGGTSYSPASRSNLDRTSSLTGNAGGGLRYYINDKLALRGDVRYALLSFDRNRFMRLYPRFAPQTDDKTLHHVEISLGLTLRFFDTDLF